MNKIFLRYSAICADTGKKLNKGTFSYYDKENKKAYCLESKKAAEIIECINTKNYIQAQENAYFDKFSYNQKPQ